MKKILFTGFVLFLIWACNSNKGADEVANDSLPSGNNPAIGPHIDTAGIPSTDTPYNRHDSTPVHLQYQQPKP